MLKTELWQLFNTDMRQLSKKDNHYGTEALDIGTRSCDVTLHVHDGWTSCFAVWDWIKETEDRIPVCSKIDYLTGILCCPPDNFPPVSAFWVGGNQALGKPMTIWRLQTDSNRSTPNTHLMAFLTLLLSLSTTVDGYKALGEDGGEGGGDGDLFPSVRESSLDGELWNLWTKCSWTG